MYKSIGIIAGVIAVGGIALIIFSDKTLDETATGNVGNTETLTLMDNEANTTLEEQTVPGDEATSMTVAEPLPAPTGTPVTNGSFETYSAEKVAAASGDVVIFFHATWCPSCRALSTNIEENIATIPAGTIILKADYDVETELKKKYGVTTQHTLVQVDSDGNLIKKWNGGSKLENLLSEIQ